MIIDVVQVYIENGSRYPFSYLFQHKISEFLSASVEVSDRFEAKYGKGFDITFFMSAKSKLFKNEIRGPDLDSKAKNVEYGISIPYSKYETQDERQYRWALENLIAGIVEVLSKYEIDVRLIENGRESIIREIVTDPLMFK